MSEKYSKLFSLPENLYTQGSPVIIKAGTLLKDNESCWLIGLLKFQSISSKIIKLAKVELTCFDSLGRNLDTPVVFEYLDLHITRGMDFGAKTPIKITNSATRSYTVRIIELGFLDNTVWSDNSCAWEQPSMQQRLIRTILKNDAVQGYKVRFGSNANFAVCEYNDLWFCACGEINHNSEERCYKCNACLADLKNIEANVLEMEGIYVSACNMANSDNIATLQNAIKEFDKIKDYKDSLILVKRCEDKALELQNANKAKKSKRNAIAKFTSIIAGGLVSLMLLGYFVIYPLVSYANGIYSIYIRMYNVTSFEIPKGEEAIVDYAFSVGNVINSESSWLQVETKILYGCEKLDSVTIPESVIYIGNYAFYDCTSLTNITIPNSVTSIGDSAFEDCTSLTSIVIPDSVTSIGDSAFEDCTSLTSIVIPDSVTSIGDGAFSDCTSLTSVVILDSVTSIGDYAFWDCTSLKDVYYTGSAADWKNISIGSSNDELTGATIHYNSKQ